MLPPHAADPWMIFHEGFYYYCESKSQQRICIRKSRTIASIGEDPGACVWAAPSFGPNSNAVWAPELHLIGGKWYIYFAADNGKNKHHRMWVLESEASDPLGPYHCRGQLETAGWAIDGTVLSLPLTPKGEREKTPALCANRETERALYLIWSGWPGGRNGQQNLYIAPMSDPLTVCGTRVLIATPDQAWERFGMPICEGPQVLSRNGKLFIIYSASGSWTVDYCLGLLAHNGGDVLDPASWLKHGPVFQKTEDIWGVGHCSFVTSPCQTEDWIIYHAKSSTAAGWHDRDVHAKRFTWTADGLPNFGRPVSRKAEAHQPASSSVRPDLALATALSHSATPANPVFANA
ncbi:MAG TPA: glycoside hydrolase family 43 protein [Verrucomicrobiae bacterium]|nr:glycoside hydrolase family 43 protein [Verrucomicrobiae bacterium]